MSNGEYRLQVSNKERGDIRIQLLRGV